MVLRYLGWSRPESWKAKADRKVESTNQRIPIQWRIDEAKRCEAKQRQDVTGDFIASMLTAREQEITSWSASIIASEVRERHCTAVEVVTSFCRRAAIGHQLINCLHEIFFEAALDRARELDAFQEQNGEVVGPLHGVPISLKDQFHVRDVETTMGYVGWINTFEGQAGSSKYKVHESVIVTELLALGAVLYCKTSLPQTLLLGETHNNVIGFTMNPLSQRLSCGGSSGGEAALIALGGSCVGVGTDIGTWRTAYDSPAILQLSLVYSILFLNPGQTIIKSAVGFMATSLLSLKLIQMALLSTKPWRADSEVVPLPWRSEQESAIKDLSFAILYNDGHCKLHPPIQRGLNMVEKALLEAGHEVLTWDPPTHREGSQLHNEFMSCDGGSNIWQQLELSGEPLIDELRLVYGKGPRSPMSLLEFQRLVLKREDYRQRYNDYWNSTSHSTKTGRPVDAVIMAVAPHAAVLPGKYYHYDYSDIVNLLDYTSVVIPVTKANQEVDIADTNYKPVNVKDKQNWEAYDAAAYDGAPVGVQIVGRRLQEERCIGLAQRIEEALQAKRV